MVRWVVRSIAHSRGMKIFRNPASGLTKVVVCAILSMGSKRVAHKVLSGTTPYNRE